MGRFGLSALGWLCQRAPWILETLLLVLPRIELYCREVIPHAVSESCKRNVSPESRRELAGKGVLLRHIGTAIIQLLRAPSNFLYLRVHLHWLFQGDEGKLIHTLSWKKRKKKSRVTVLDLALWRAWVECCRKSITLTATFGFPFLETLSGLVPNEIHNVNTPLDA